MQPAVLPILQFFHDKPGALPLSVCLSSAKRGRQLTGAGPFFVYIVYMGYLAICNYKGLIPDAGPKTEEDGNIESLLINAPKWFTPLTELPRL